MISSTGTLLHQPAPEFSLPSVQGEAISLASYQPKHSVLLWFSRGITCPFCREHMNIFAKSHDALKARKVEVIQIAPNLLQAARLAFRHQYPIYPFVCDPDKRLFARYQLGDQGVLTANRNTFISFGHAFTHGEGQETVRNSWLDVMNRNFIQRLHHHALTAIEQGLFLIDPNGIIRYQEIFEPISALPDPIELLDRIQMPSFS